MASPTMQSVLVTGATGLIGRRFVTEVAGRCETWATSRHVPPDPPSGVHWIAHDFAGTALPSGLPERVDTVVHLAQAADHRNFPAGAPAIYSVATHATMQLLDWAYRTGARRFILASTGGLYAPSAQPITEASPLTIQDDPLAFYLTAKRMGEMLAERYAAALTVVVLRFFFVYGPGQRSTMLFPRLMASVMNGKPLSIQGRDGIRLNPLHVDDAARAIARCCELDDSTTINVAGPETVSMRQIGELIGEGLGRLPLFDCDPAVPRCWAADISRMRALLGEPSVLPAVGIPQVAQAFLVPQR